MQINNRANNEINCLHEHSGGFFLRCTTLFFIIFHKGVIFVRFDSSDFARVRLLCTRWSLYEVTDNPFMLPRFLNQARDS